MLANSELKSKNIFANITQSKFSTFLPVALALIVIWLYFGLTTDAFFSARNFYYLFLQSTVVAVLAVGITIVLLLGHIDLSIAAVAGVGAAIMAVLVSQFGMSAPLACVIAIFTCILIGVVQGLLVAIIGIPSFVVTLAGLLGFQGVMLKILGNDGAINVRDSFIRGITTETLPTTTSWIILAFVILFMIYNAYINYKERAALSLEVESIFISTLRVSIVTLISITFVWVMNSYRGIPVAIVILLCLTLLFSYVTKNTPYGRALFAVGGNEESARRVGISIQKTTIYAFAIIGGVSALGGIIAASRYASVSYNAFSGNLLLDAIGAAVVGGTSLFGGRGSVWNAILGALVIGSLGNGLDLTGATTADKLMVSALILVSAVAIDAISRKKGKKV
ncbi:sugar ABC transporter permease [Marinomonas flavescens]|uniref:sugar ABC transporter permease n=1 Tax=Marinomonas flavescens TaxID=2529379 RepID=UPI0010568732|nr:ABC transporter permease [Marinomonas flavescens]